MKHWMKINFTHFHYIFISRIRDQDSIMRLRKHRHFLLILFSYTAGLFLLLLYSFYLDSRQRTVELTKRAKAVSTWTMARNLSGTANISSDEHNIILVRLLSCSDSSQGWSFRSSPDSTDGLSVRQLLRWGHLVHNSTARKSLANFRHKNLSGKSVEYIRSGSDYYFVSNTVLQFESLNDLYFLSATYDNRAPSDINIRLMALLRRNQQPTLYCSVTESGAKALLRISKPATLYEMCENHSKQYGGWILSCMVPPGMANIPLDAVFLSRRKEISNNMPRLSLRQPDELKAQFSIGVCVSPLYGNIRSSTLIEFVEMNIRLGANRVILYVEEISEENLIYLHEYVTCGTVELLFWKLPVEAKEIWYHGQLIAVNDCLYRHMHLFDYIVFSDLDEFIVPHQHDTWKAMISSFERNSPVGQNLCAFSFTSAFFEPVVSEKRSPGHDEFLYYELNSDLRTTSMSKVRRKVIVRPTKIFEIGIHHVSKMVDDTCTVYFVPPEVAFVHHYRKCSNDFDREMNCKSYTRDEHMMTFLGDITDRVDRVRGAAERRMKCLFDNRTL